MEKLNVLLASSEEEAREMADKAEFVAIVEEDEIDMCIYIPYQEAYEKVKKGEKKFKLKGGIEYLGEERDYEDAVTIGVYDVSVEEEYECNVEGNIISMYRTVNHIVKKLREF